MINSISQRIFEIYPPGLHGLCIRIIRAELVALNDKAKDSPIPGG